MARKGGSILMPVAQAASEGSTTSAVQGANQNLRRVLSMQQVFDEQAGNVSSEDFHHFGGANGLLNLYIAGNLNGGSVVVEAQTPTGEMWVPVDGGAITEAGLYTVVAAPFVGRLTITGAASGSSVSAWVEREAYRTLQRVEGS